MRCVRQVPWEQITGDNVLIARETARALGLGTRIRTPEGLPSLPASGRVPKDLGATLAPAVLASDGFAQARRPTVCVSALLFLMLWLMFFYSRAHGALPAFISVQDLGVVLLLTVLAKWPCAAGSSLATGPGCRVTAHQWIAWPQGSAS